MKNKLIAMLLTGSMLGGVGAGAYLTAGPGEKSEAAQIQTVKLCNGKIVKSNDKYNCLGLKDEIIKALLNGNSNNVKNKESKNAKSTDSKAKKNTSVAKSKSNNKKTTAKKITVKKVTVKPIGNKVLKSNNASKTNSVAKKSNTVTKKNNVINKNNVSKNNNGVKKNNTVKNNNVSKNTTSINNSGQASIASEKFMAQVEQKIFEKVNIERQKAGASKLSYNKTMEKYARIKSQDMGDRGYFDHKDPQGNLITVKMKNDGVSYRAWGENIAYIGGVSDADALANQFMTNWMNSQGHRENILSKNFSSIGVGVYKMGNRVYATQEFYK